MPMQFDSSIIRDTLEKNARENRDRRRFLRNAGIAGIAAALAATPLGEMAAAAQGSTVTDVNILNFALNLEYLEAEFYVQAAFGRGLADADTTGTGTRGAVTGGRQVRFVTEAIRQYAVEIANDEEAHVRFLRTALGSAAVARPAINIMGGSGGGAFAAASAMAGLAPDFDPYLNENNFLLAAYIFEDVGVTAYKGSARFIQNRDFLESAAGILAVEAYHAANIRTVLFARGLSGPSIAISNLRDSVDGADDRDQGIVMSGMGNIVPSDANAIAFSRTPRQVANIVYLAENAASGGFFPAGINGTLPIV